MIYVYNLITKKEITTYSMNTDMQTLLHDIEANGYYMVSMCNTCFDITLTQHTEDIAVMVLEKNN